MGIDFVKEDIVNGRHVSEYRNDKTDRPVVFIDGCAVEKSFVKACADCRQEDDDTHAIEA